MFAPEVAGYARCHVQTVYKAQRSGALKGAQAKPNAVVRFHRDDVDAWLKGETQPVKRRGPRRRLHKVS